jgi:leucyl aminopeptidase
MTRILAVKSLEKALAQGGGYDAVVVTGHAPAAVDVPLLKPFLRAAAAADAKFASTVSFVPAAGVAGGRLVVAPTGPLGRDHDDVRRHAEAARAGLRRARDAGANSVLLVLQAPPRGGAFEQAAVVAALGAVGGLWEPLEAREAIGEDVEPVRKIGVACLGSGGDERALAWVEAAESGLRLARDLCGTDPERMAPPKFATFVQQAFKGLPVKVTVQKDGKKLLKDYPLLMAVARASMGVLRHRPCVVRLEYTPKGKIERTLLFAGKGPHVRHGRRGPEDRRLHGGHEPRQGWCCRGRRPRARRGEARCSRVRS